MPSVTPSLAGENSGTWGFVVADGKNGSAMSREANSDDRIGLSFRSDDNQNFSCSVDLAIIPVEPRLRRRPARQRDQG
ncbi:hypothetical protein ACWD5R_37530 [Streptomyces sp. NPDC002514]|uniref:hypothetical protein n=1 Tax=Streptomyces sp. NPDC001270 TaxID=3364554 RepID=UPI0036A010FF